MPNSNRHAAAALAILIVLQLTMLSALYAGIEPHPPIATPLFGIAPFIGASVSLALAAIMSKPATSAAGRGLSVLAVLSALVSFGPQKYVDPNFGLIWPAVMLGQVAASVIVIEVVRISRRRRSDPMMASDTGRI
ncbi:hypothetical protein SAMN05421759_11053 [Roseivivax lentus]|uniref:SPW repeat-containing protein n=1 Tax=Roseivivax lentus TaxID=633194 RepID=A0A1N7NU17_9RHOB|nr:hypothetical protein [Roseivivax lentus]SIT01766.1 hypothetical protein SAMN05421759_11053 [Roseivivax lentus]